MADNNVVERELSWNDTIEHDASFDFIVLPKGDYPFTVTAFERARHEPKPDGKLPACNKAVLTIDLDGGAAGIATIRYHLFLHTRMEGRLCEFFAAIGQRKTGEKHMMDWNKVIGSKGKCKVKIREWNKDNGEKGQSNEIDKFYEPVAAPSQSYQAGRF